MAARHLDFICRFIWTSNQEPPMNVRYRVKLTRYERDELGVVSEGKNRARKLKRDPIGRGRGGQR